MKKKYTRPHVLNEVQCKLEMNLLAGSIVQNIEAIEIEGQEVDDFYDGGGSTFNHEWGN